MLLRTDGIMRTADNAYIDILEFLSIINLMTKMKMDF